MGNWTEIERQALELAERVRGRFEAHGLGLLATLRKDGSPRISGMELLFGLDEIWLGMMQDSLKALDLLRDPRFALHSATTDKQVSAGDAKIAGVAVAVEDDASLQAFRQAFSEHSGSDAPPPPFHLFKLDIREMSILVPEGDHLNIDIWTAAGGLQHVERR
ncbi:MAG TPA: pyridoxamine 5'-phosphate oxidase family protein [Chloroflexota bacterium]|jgi:general stress protein 26|nr:pyridoxamine 5'-phosphate oxidase family protein [Chloroflexota bacterium]